MDSWRHKLKQEEFDEQAAMNMLLYFIQNANNRTLERTKLMCLCYFADFDHYERYGCSISGTTYYKLPQGPHSYQINELLQRMESPKLIDSRKFGEDVLNLVEDAKDELQDIINEHGDITYIDIRNMQHKLGVQVERLYFLAQCKGILVRV